MSSAGSRIVNVRLVLGVVALAAVACGAWLLREPGRPDPLVVYCAAERAVAEPLLREFERQTGIPVRVEYSPAEERPLTFDQRLLEERAAPRCDVFWNDQPLITNALLREGLFEPYRGPGWARIPPAYRARTGEWVGFAGRFRVHLVHGERVEPTLSAVNAALTADDLSRVVIADPRYGSTLAQYALLWHDWGPTRLKAWHGEMQARGIRVARGNAAAARLVASGECDLGWADTGDYFAVKSERGGIAMLPVEAAGRGTLCLPQTAAIVRGTTRLDAAQRLVDFLASKESELALARSARFVPLGPVNEKELPEDVRPLREWAGRGRDLNELDAALGACLEWIRSI